MRSVSFLATLVVATLTAWQAFALDIGPPAPGSACDVETRKFLAPTGGIGLRVAVELNLERDATLTYRVADEFVGEAPDDFNLAMLNDYSLRPDDVLPAWALSKDAGGAWVVVRSDYLAQIFIPVGVECLVAHDPQRLPRLNPADFPPGVVGPIFSSSVPQPPKG